jgi:hypothetical protein
VQVAQSDVPRLLSVEEQVEGQEESEHQDRAELHERTDHRRGLLGQPALDLLGDLVQRRGDIDGHVGGGDSALSR